LRVYRRQVPVSRITGQAAASVVSRNFVPHLQNHKRCFINDFEALTYPNYLRDGTLVRQKLRRLAGYGCLASKGDWHNPHRRLGWGSEYLVSFVYSHYPGVQAFLLAGIPFAVMLFGNGPDRSDSHPCLHLSP
jgi:hypothetical protein